MGIYVNGIGIIGGFGAGVDNLVTSLNNGSAPNIKFSDKDTSDINYPSYVADTSCLTDFVPKRELRRIDHFSQLALTGAFLTLKDAGIDRLDSKSTGLVICSGYGSSRTTFSFLDSIIDNGDECASPTLFSNSVHNSAAGHVSILLGLAGPCLTVTQFEMSVHSALISALTWLEQGNAEQILFGAVDEGCTVLNYCYKKFFGKREDYHMMPLAQDRQSAIPGEGAVFFILSKDKSSGKDYGAIESVLTETINDSVKEFPEKTFYIINADGHKECDMKYADIIPYGALTSCYTPLFGSFPTCSAFDMAIGAVSFNKGRYFPSPDCISETSGIKVLKKEHLLDSSYISCLNIGSEGKIGIINMSICR
jgi:3-oxoacyl-[acyl-carrier-protein] synthase II